MRLGKKQRTRTNDQDLHHGVSDRPAPVAIPSAKRIGDGVTRCGSQDCWEHNIITLEHAAVSARIGYILYKRWGAMFVPEFDVNTEGDDVTYVHASCAIDGGLVLEELNMDCCCLCDHQFLCMEEPKEAVAFFVLGHFDPSPKGHGYKFQERDGPRGAVHWSCANWRWTPEFCASFEGPDHGGN